jgi:hypothetical protein
MKEFFERFDPHPQNLILDVGGDPFNWSLISEQARIVYLNLPTRKVADRSWIIANGQRLPYADKKFDIVYSNSVIEHLGNIENQESYANEVRRVGVKYYVQTPSRGFPIEPHLMTPLIHWFPRSLQRRLLRNFTIWGLVTRPSRAEVDSFLAEVNLLDKLQLQVLLPDSEIWLERVLGFPTLLTINTRKGCN